MHSYEVSSGYNLAQLVLAVSGVIDLVEPRLADHHRRVARAAAALAPALGLGSVRTLDLVLAALIHDVGAFKLGERIGLLSFEEGDMGRHCVYGSRMVERCKPLARLAPLVLGHHTRWDERGRTAVHEDAHLLHLADRIAVGLPPGPPPRAGVDELKMRIASQRGRKFSPDATDAFLSLAQTEYFWFDLCFGGGGVLAAQDGSAVEAKDLDLQGLLELSRFFCAIVDYRSHFTATHSWGVAATASELAVASGWGGGRPVEMEIAGYLHDIGKMAVPTEVIEKPGPLDPQEWFQMKQHPYHTRALLDAVDGLATVRDAGAYHHERAGNRSYPFHLDPALIPPEAHLLAVSDVFTALTEARPYRAGLDYHGTRAAMAAMVEEGLLAGDYVRLLMKDFDRFDQVRARAQETARYGYDTVVM